GKSLSTSDRPLRTVSAKRGVAREPHAPIDRPTHAEVKVTGRFRKLAPAGQRELWFGIAGAPRFTFVDLFAGIGGVRLGLEANGGDCVYSVEIDRYARKTYIRNFGSCEADDIRDLPAQALPTYDLLAAGFPCQPFSIAGVSKKLSLGRKHGFEDEKSGNLSF